jgi:hypothetical protein
VHQLLSTRLEYIFDLFCQVPDVLETVWIDVAPGQVDAAKRRIDAIPDIHPFGASYAKVENIDWETCSTVLSQKDKQAALRAPW